MLAELIFKVKQTKSINKIRVVLALLLLPFLFFYQNCGKMNAVKVGDNGNTITSIIPSHQIQISAYNSCALLSNQKVKCWGHNIYNILGISSFLGTNGLASIGFPVELSVLSDVKEVFFGRSHLCGLTSTKKVKCWGSNNYGQLGNGSTDLSATRLVEVSNLENVTQISVGFHHSCALLSTKKVKCWGHNIYGQLGNVATETELFRTPVDVSDLQQVTQISAGSYHSCALLSDKKVKCWGYNSLGQLGNVATTNQLSRKPVDVSDLQEVTQISVGGHHSCALTSDKKVKCWGYNFYGQLGNNSTINSTSPVLVLGGLDNVTQISVGDSHSCALLLDKKVKCWGFNFAGQLGNSDTGVSNTSYSSTPVDVSGLENVTQISVGYEHSCALLSTKKVKCWGNNNAGQVGNGVPLLNPFSPTPVEVQNPY